MWSQFVPALADPDLDRRACPLKEPRLQRDECLERQRLVLGGLEANLDLAAAETARFDNDMTALNLMSCWSEPRATSAIRPMM